MRETQLLNAIEESGWLKVRFSLIKQKVIRIKIVEKKVEVLIFSCAATQYTNLFVCTCQIQSLK